MQPARELVVGIERGEYPRLVPGTVKLAGERLDVARNPARVGPGVRREERDPHPNTLARTPGGNSFACDNRRCDDQPTPDATGRELSPCPPFAALRT